MQGPSMGERKASRRIDADMKPSRRVNPRQIKAPQKQPKRPNKQADLKEATHSDRKGEHHPTEHSPRKNHFRYKALEPIPSADGISPIWAGNRRICKTVNCYAYALNLPMNPLMGGYFRSRDVGGFGLQPGKFSQDEIFGGDITEQKLPAFIEKDVKAMGGNLVPCEFETVASKGSWKIALRVEPYNDYHFYRQHADGTWSHKPGSHSPTNLDSDGRVIVDPRKATHRVGHCDYFSFAGFFIYTPPKDGISRFRRIPVEELCHYWKGHFTTAFQSPSTSTSSPELL